MRKITVETIEKLIHAGELREDSIATPNNFAMDGEIATVALGAGPWNAEQLEKLAADLRNLEKAFDNDALEMEPLPKT